METRYQILVAAVERAINEADPIDLLKAGAPSDEYAPEIGTILPRLESAQRPDDVTAVLYEEFLRWFGDGTAGLRKRIRGASATDLGRGVGVSPEHRRARFALDRRAEAIELPQPVREPVPSKAMRRADLQNLQSVQLQPRQTRGEDFWTFVAGLRKWRCRNAIMRPPMLSP